MAAKRVDSEPKVAVLGSLRFAPERTPEVLPHLSAVVKATYEHDGCIAYDVAVDPFDPGLIRFSELWPDHASLQRHQAAAHIEAWRAAVRACGVLARSFTVYEIASSRAL